MPVCFDRSHADVRSIYVVRLCLTTYYSYRASTVQINLDGLQKQRDVTIEKLKAATKYNTTQQLLTKYGGTPTPKVKPIESTGQRSSPNSATPRGARTAIVPPPTANIPGRNVRAPLQDTPDRSTPSAQRSLELSETSSPKALITPRQQQSAFRNESADFAPNAFSAAPQYSQPDQGSQWYDRILDVLLGDDEMLPRNRLALICRHCRLVNGQAPPTIKRLEDVGRWRCSGCGIMNGEETDAEKIVADIKEQAVTETDKPNRKMRTRRSFQEVRTDNEEPQADDGHESDITQYSEDLDIVSSTSEKDMEKENMSEPSAEPEPPKRRVGRPKGSGKKQS